MLILIHRYQYLPVAQFVLRAEGEDELQMIALAPVALESADEEMDVIKARGAILKSLEDKNLITLDYDIPISGYDYQGYKDSVAFKQLETAAKEAQGQQGFLFDIAAMELGSMALTDRGESLLK